jgi:hypothetical protein
MIKVNPSDINPTDTTAPAPVSGPQFKKQLQ